MVLLTNIQGNKLWQFWDDSEDFSVDYSFISSETLLSQKAILSLKQNRNFTGIV
jgi:hypothetical protein